MGQEVSTPVAEPVAEPAVAVQKEKIVVETVRSETPASVVEGVGAAPPTSANSFSTASRKAKLRKPRMNVTLLHETLGNSNSSRTSRKSFRFNKDDNSILVTSSNEHSLSSPKSQVKDTIVEETREFPKDIIEEARESVKEIQRAATTTEKDADTAAECSLPNAAATLPKSFKFNAIGEETSLAEMSRNTSLQPSVLTDLAKIPGLDDETVSSSDKRMYLQRKQEEQEALAKIDLLRNMLRTQYDASSPKTQTTSEKVAKSVKEEVHSTASTEQTSNLSITASPKVNESQPEEPKETDDKDWESTSKASIKSPKDIRSVNSGNSAGSLQPPGEVASVNTSNTSKKSAMGVEVVYSKNVGDLIEQKSSIEVFHASSTLSSVKSKSSTDDSDPDGQLPISPASASDRVEINRSRTLVDNKNQPKSILLANNSESGGESTVDETKRNELLNGDGSGSTGSSRDPAGHNASVGDAPELAKRSFEWSVKKGKLSLSEFNDETTQSDSMTELHEDRVSPVESEDLEASTTESKPKTNDSAVVDSCMRSPRVEIVNYPGSNEGYEKDIDELYVEQYEELFKEFASRKPRFVEKESEFMGFLKIVKLQKILEAMTETKMSLLNQANQFERRKGSMSKSYHAQLLESSQNKAKREIELEKKMEELRAEKAAMEADLSWQCIMASDERAKNQQNILSDLTYRRSRGDDLLAFLPDIPEAIKIKECLAKHDDLSADDMMRETVHFQVDNALLQAETVILECHSQNLFQDAAKYTWLDNMFAQMTNEDLDALKEMYASKVGVKL